MGQSHIGKVLTRVSGQFPPPTYRRLDAHRSHLQRAGCFHWQLMRGQAWLQGHPAWGVEVLNPERREQGLAGLGCCGRPGGSMRWGPWARPVVARLGEGLPVC